MEVTPSTSSGGPAPFLLKTYDMIDDSSTDEIVSWSSSNTSFIVWNPPEFARLLLPTYFKHNNFSSFIRQLNTYGFRKIDPERWEFANEDFIKDKKHLLKNIHRRKPIHSHSHPPPDPERVAFEEEMEKLSREKNELDSKLSGFKMHHCAAKSQLEDITQRISSMEQRQEKLLTHLHTAVQNPAFVEHLAQKMEAMDLTAYNKKRRLPLSDHFLPAMENNFGDNQSCYRPEVANYQQDMSNKLKLELSTAVSNMNLVSNSAHSSNEDWASPSRRSSGTDPRSAELGTCTQPFAMETVELSDTATCLAFRMDAPLSDKVGVKECLGLQSLQQSLVPAEEGQICCQLNLSLASSPVQVQPNQGVYSGKPTHMDMDGSGSQGTRPDSIGSNRYNFGTKSNQSIGNVGNLLSSPEARSNNGNCNVGNVSSSQETRSNNNQDPAPAAPARVNDQFWEQFLTERPGVPASDAEEASSCYRALPGDEPEDRGSSHGMSRAAKNLGKLTL